MARQDSYKAPWEHTFRRVATPIEDFVHKETASGLLLIIATAIALFLANGPFYHEYHAFFESKIGFSINGHVMEHTLHHWINDGLMALFFFVVGLEIKREALIGELSSPKKAALPMLAALGGMVVPALFYYVINDNMAGGYLKGWGVPMATDIAFAVGVLVLLGDRIPKSLLAFLMALAIVDDLGAVMVIAIFYTDTINFELLMYAGACFGVLMIFNLAGVRSMLPHFLVGLLMWLFMLDSGVHATIAGVAGALTVPGRPKYSTRNFSRYVRGLLDKFDAHQTEASTMNSSDEQRYVVQKLAVAANSVESPIRLWEQRMHVLVAFFIIPFFALANAGVEIEMASIGDALTHPVALGVMVGLIVGKTLGIAGITVIAAKLGIGQLPVGVKGRDMIGIGLLGGIGFTMSIFITELAFKPNAASGINEMLSQELINYSKIGILFASILAAVLGLAWLALVKKRPARE